MLILTLENENISWLAPYAYLIVLLGFAIFLFRFFENWYAATFNKPLYRQLWWYKTLSKSEKRILEKEFFFYSQLSLKYKKQFLHRVATFLNEKQFVGRQDFEITERVKILIAAVGCMLTFGRKNYNYALINHILVYPNEFFSNLNNKYHKGEFNPKEKALVLSWKHFEEGYQITNDNLNLGIHEFMHALHLEAKKSADIDSSRFIRQFKVILHSLSQAEIKEKLEQTYFFRTYAFTNQYEFMAVLAEYFFESPTELKNEFPNIYNAFKKLLNFNFAGY